MAVGNTSAAGTPSQPSTTAPRYECDLASEEERKSVAEMMRSVGKKIT